MLTAAEVGGIWEPEEGGGANGRKKRENNFALTRTRAETLHNEILSISVICPHKISRLKKFARCFRVRFTIRYETF